MKKRMILTVLVLLMGTSTIVTADNSVDSTLENSENTATNVSENEIVYESSVAMNGNGETVENESDSNITIDNDESDHTLPEESNIDEAVVDPIEVVEERHEEEASSTNQVDQSSAVESDSESSDMNNGYPEESSSIEKTNNLNQSQVEDGEVDNSASENKRLELTNRGEETAALGVSATREDLQPNEIYVSSFQQLKGYIEHNTTHSYNKFRFTNDIEAEDDVITVPEGYSFTVSGLSPLDGKIYKYIETNSNSYSITMNYNYPTPIDINFENLIIEGKRSKGFVKVSSTTIGSTINFQNVKYKGPQVFSNPSGNVIIKDSDMNVNTNGGTQVAVRVGEAKNVEFFGNNIIDQKSTDETVFKMGNNNSIIFREGSRLQLQANRGMNEQTEVTKILFEAGSSLIASQHKNLDKGALFYLNGEGSDFKMMPGSNLSLTRSGYTTSTESIISTDYQANVTLDNSVLTYEGSGIQETNGLIKANTLQLTPGTDLTFRINGQLSINVLDIHNFNKFDGNKFKVLVNGSLKDAGINDYIIERYHGGEFFSIKNSEITIEGKDSQMVLVGGGGLEIINSKLVFNYSNNMTRDIFYFDEIRKIKDSEIDLYFNESSAPFLFTRVGFIEINDSKIKVVGNAVKNRLIWARDLRFNNQNSGLLDIELSGNVMSEVIRVDKQLISNKQEININAHGEIQKGPFIRVEDEYEPGGLIELNDTNLNFKGRKNLAALIKSETINLNGSKIDFQSESIESPQINTNDLSLNNSDVDIVGVLTKGTSIIETSGLKLLGSNLHLDSGLGDLNTLILMREGELSVDKSSRLALVGPFTKSLIQTKLSPVKVTFEAEQINQWGSLGIEISKKGFDYLPTYRYLTEGEFSTLSFLYVNNTNTMETIDYKVNDFIPAGEDALKKTFSLFNAKTKVLSVGYSRFPKPIVPAGALGFTAQADPSSYIRMRYHSDNVPKETEALAEEDGQYTMQTEKLGYQPVHFDYYYKYFYGYDFEAIPEETGSLKFGSMPSTVSFGQQMIPKKQTTYNKEEEMNLAIIDDRSGGVRWKLEIEVTSDIYDKLGNRVNIPGKLVFKDNRGTKVLEKNQRYTVAVSDGSTPINEVLNFAKGEGLLLRIDDGSLVYLDGKYTVDFKWILSTNE